MTTQSKFPAVQHCLLFTRVASIAAIVVGGLVLAGWLLDIMFLKSIMVSRAVMKPNTAVCFILSGLALWLLGRSQGRVGGTDSCRKWATGCAGVVALVGLVTMGEHFLNFDAGVDSLLFPSSVAATPGSNGGRMSPAASLGFVLLGMALILMDRETRGGHRPAQYLALAVAVVGLIGFNGYTVGVEAMYRTFAYSTMSLHTSVLFVLVGLGVIFARPERGLMKEISSEYEGGRIARLLLPVAVALPIVLGLLEVLGRRTRLFEEEAGEAFFTAAYVLVLSRLIFSAARSLNRSDARRREAEEHNRRLAAIVSSSEDAIVGKTLEGVITSWNRGAEQLYGYTESEMLGKNISLLTPPGHEEEISGFVDQVQRGETIHRHETVRRRKDGVLVDVSLTISPIFDSDGVVAGASVMAHDIAARKQAEESLRQSEARFAGIVNSAMDAIVSIDGDHRIVLFNPAAERMFGVQADQMLGRPLDRLLPEQFSQTHQEHIQMFGQTSSSSRGIGRLGTINGRRANGEEFPIEASISQIQVGNQKLFTAILRDVTDRRRAEKQLREQATLLDGATDGIFMRDLSDRVLYWNKGAERIFGYTAEEMLGRSSRVLKTGEEKEAAFNEAKRITFERGEWSGEWPAHNKAGHQITIESRWTLLKDDEGQPRGILVITRDITQKKMLEAQFLRAQRLESIGTLAGGIAHDFNNILAGILGSIEVVSAELPPDHAAQEFLTQARKAGSRGADLVRRILTFSVKQELDRQAIQLPLVVAEALKLLRATLPAMIEIRTDFASDVPPVFADITQIHQVIMNLGSNAAHAMGERGLLEVRLETVLLTEEMVRIAGSLCAGRYVQLSVSDSGCGMNKETLERIFEPFFTTKRSGQGTGLGLAVVHGIVKSHKGVITVESQPGQGTTFRLFFPIVESAVAEDRNVHEEFTRGNGEHVLYVDDEEIVVSGTTRVLKRMGYKVTSHTDVALALQAFRSRPQDYDVVVCDLAMPGMSGLEFVREVFQVRPNTPVILTTGYLSPQDTEAAGRVGVRHLLLKPSTFEKLGQTLRDALSDRKNQNPEQTQQSVS